MYGIAKPHHVCLLSANSIKRPHTPQHVTPSLSWIFLDFKSPILVLILHYLVYRPVFSCSVHITSCVFCSRQGEKIMFRWHESTCSKPFIKVLGGLPWCHNCYAVPPTDEDIDFQDDLGPPRPPSWESRKHCSLAWPAVVTYDEEDSGDEDESLGPDHNDTVLPAHDGR